ncbi:MAG: ABC transporter permease [Clostridia bacterium]|nr:ABC transporter permease [Clostridia bacterium]
MSDRKIPDASAAVKKQYLSLSKLRDPNVVLFIVGVVIILSISLFVPKFMTWRNISNVIVQTSSIGLMAIGLTFVIITAGIDLSLPMNMAFSAIIGCTVMAKTQSVAAGVCTILLVAMAIGAFNGLSVAKFKMVPMIVTLAVATVASGASNWITGAKSIGGLPASFKQIFAGDMFGVPTQAVILIVVAVVMHLLLSKTTFGQHLYQTGINEKTAKVCGVNTERIKFLIYLISGLMAGIAGVLGSAKLASAGPSLGTQDQFMNIVCATVIGGASVMGGKGTILGTIIGSIFMSTISNVMNLYGVEYFITFVIKGSVVILFTYFDLVRNKIGEVRVR